MAKMNNSTNKEEKWQYKREWNREIALLSHFGKVCAKALERRMISIVQPHICKIQLWFRKYTSDVGALLSLRQLNEKCIECDGQLNTAFIDQ